MYHSFCFSYLFHVVIYNSCYYTFSSFFPYFLYIVSLFSHSCPFVNSISLHSFHVSLFILYSSTVPCTFVHFTFLCPCLHHASHDIILKSTFFYRLYLIHVPPSYLLLFPTFPLSLPKGGIDIFHIFLYLKVVFLNYKRPSSYHSWFISQCSVPFLLNAYMILLAWLKITKHVILRYIVLYVCTFFKTALDCHS